jgi:hypothetical protein
MGTTTNVVVNSTLLKPDVVMSTKGRAKVPPVVHEVSDSDEDADEDADEMANLNRKAEMMQALQVVEPKFGEKWDVDVVPLKKAKASTCSFLVEQLQARGVAQVVGV